MTLEEFSQMPMLPLCQVARDDKHHIFTEINNETGVIRINVAELNSAGQPDKQYAKYQVGSRFFDTIEAAYAAYAEGVGS